MTAPPSRAAPSLPESTITRLLDAIERQTGLSRDSGLRTRLQRALQSRQRSELLALLPRLETLPWQAAEWQTLIARLLVHETYFFRDWPQLEHLAESGLPDRIADARATGRRSLRLWSAGCASGEEAYTLAAITLRAMVLSGVALERGETAQPAAGWSLDVVGSDLSDDMIAHAARGTYTTAGLSPFRAMREDYGRLFPASGDGTRSVRPDLRARVRFARDNLLDGPPPVTDADVVACRNVLVYFAEAARRVALGKLIGALAPGGYLLLSPTDPRPPDDQFDAIWSAGPVIYRRRRIS